MLLRSSLPAVVVDGSDMGHYDLLGVAVYTHYFITALYRHGFHAEAEQMLWAQVDSFDKGTFNSGVRIPHMPCRNPVGSAFFKWDGARANGEGYLPEN